MTTSSVSALSKQLESLDLQRDTYSTLRLMTPSTGLIWRLLLKVGTLVDSEIGGAAVDAAVLTLEVLPGPGSYPGTTNNGITSMEWDQWYRSYRFVE